ncbi:MBL fold metallo-hydrolase [candidate division WOR-3 bacterium]|nr:MBL fold metallo-hydrolase [candidate division WOR-3 bacterium]
MLIQHFFVEKIAHSSYILVGTRECAVVDPRRDVEVYLEWARQRGFRIRLILETHLHADFVSGHRDLAAATGAEIVAPRAGGCRFPHRAVGEGDRLELEDLEIRVLETPGHTPEHVSYVVHDRARGADPVGVFCGDTLFVGDVGRPDLFPGRARDLATALYSSLHDKLLKLPDSCEVWPAHGAGSLCGRAMGAKWTSTIGYERRNNRALGSADRDEFVRSLTTRMPPAPDHFRRCSDINRDGPALVADLPQPGPLGPAEFRQRSSGDATVLDVRSYDAFGGQHVPGSWNIPETSNLPTFAGWVLPPDRPLLLVADDAAQAERAATWLRRVGLDRVEGRLEGGMTGWSADGLPAGHVPQLSATEAFELLHGSERVAVVDVRSPLEFAAGHIEGAKSIPAPDLRERWRELDPAVRTMVACSTGQRSSLAAGILRQHGFRRVLNLAGGMTGYSASGHAPRCPVCFVPHGSHFLGRADAMVGPEAGD